MLENFQMPYIYIPLQLCGKMFREPNNFLQHNEKDKKLLQTVSLQEMCVLFLQLKMRIESNDEETRTKEIIISYRSKELTFHDIRNHCTFCLVSIFSYEFKNKNSRVAILMFSILYNVNIKLCNSIEFFNTCIIIDC